MSALTVTLSGDCMATRGALISDDPSSRRLRDLLRGADFSVTNLELALAGRGHPVPNAAGGGCLIAAPSAVQEVLAAGFDVFGCANNHALDLGVEGVLGALDVFRSRAVPFAGIGVDLASARRPVYVDRPAGSLALISCTSTFQPGQEAADPSPDLPGRPGVSPLRYTATVEVTPGQLAALRELDASTGLWERRAEARNLLGFDPAMPSADALNLFGTRFRSAARSGFGTACDPRDLDAVARWVREARSRADVVVVAVHSHEPGPHPELPGEFLREFARRMIDEGADVVAGHGPHHLRGVEVYRGRPIFYSLGNVVSQIDLADRVAGEDYERAGAGRDPAPGEYFDRMSGGGRRMFGPHRRYWESVVPKLIFDDGRLISAELHPIGLGFGEPVHRRGRPRLADGTEGKSILDEMARLSEPYGTTMTLGGDGPGTLDL